MQAACSLWLIFTGIALCLGKSHGQQYETSTNDTSTTTPDSNHSKHNPLNNTAPTAPENSDGSQTSTSDLDQKDTSTSIGNTYRSTTTIASTSHNTRPADDRTGVPFRVVAAICVLLILLLVASLVVLYKNNLGLCECIYAVKDDFPALICCRYIPPEFDSEANANGGDNTLGTLPPPRILNKTMVDDRAPAIILTESMVDLNTIGVDPMEEESEEEEEDPENNKDPPQPTTAVNVSDFITYYGTNDVNKDKLRKEFQELGQWSSALPMKRTHAKLEKNKIKNRYFDITPYDYNRVPLYEVPGIKGISEYRNLSPKDRKKIGFINSSFVHEYGGSKIKYIAAQGPLNKTISHFWEMVWQEESDIIVMLTSLREQGRLKCEQYWPKEKGDSLVLKDVTIKLEVWQGYAFYDYRIMTLKRQTEERLVYHYQYHHWPDKEAPEMVLPVLDLYRKVFSPGRVLKGPAVIHCSAGVGRTGTFISIDYLLEQARQSGMVDIQRCVYELRRQRVCMVQKVTQYIFLYEAIHEALDLSVTSIPAAHFKEWFREAENDENFSLLRQFEKMQNKKPRPPHPECMALLPENKDKNRFPDIIPEDSRRPYLFTYMKGRTTYVNAVNVDTFLETENLIATQLPLPHTMEDFWRLVYDRNCNSVILLQDINTDDESCPCYWPDDTEERTYGGVLTVSGADDKKRSTSIINVRNYKVILKQQPEYIVGVKIFQLRTWLEGQHLPQSKLDIVELISMWRKYKKSTTIVQCLDGAGRSGLFCACVFLMDQIQTDHEVDVYHACRMVTASRRQFIPSKEQYKFLHEFALEYIQTFDDYSNFAEAGIAPNPHATSQRPVQEAPRYKQKRRPLPLPSESQSPISSTPRTQSQRFSTDIKDCTSSTTQKGPPKLDRSLVRSSKHDGDEAAQNEYINIKDAIQMSQSDGEMDSHSSSDSDYCQPCQRKCPDGISDNTAMNDQELSGESGNTTDNPCLVSANAENKLPSTNNGDSINMAIANSEGIDNNNKSDSTEIGPNVGCFGRITSFDNKEYINIGDLVKISKAECKPDIKPEKSEYMNIGDLQRSERDSITGNNKDKRMSSPVIGSFPLASAEKRYSNVDLLDGAGNANSQGNQSDNMYINLAPDNKTAAAVFHCKAPPPSTTQDN